MAGTTETKAISVPTAVPISQVVPWALLGGILVALAYYFVGVEQGATSMVGGSGIHEWVHDARHLLGFPCH